MNYRVVANGGGVEVFLEGVLNFAANDDFQAMLEQVLTRRSQQVVLNLGGLTNIDSVGLGLLYIAQEDIEGSGATLMLKGARDNVARLLDLTEADKTFRIAP